MDTIMEIFTILGVAWALLLALKFIAERAEFKDNIERIKVEADKRIRVVQLEKIATQGNLILAYDGENNDFLGQGATVQEVKESIMSRYPEKFFILEDKVFSKIQDQLEVQIGNSNSR
jgi:hypothetical protein